MAREVVWPPLPAVFEAPLGPVRVERVRELVSREGHDLLGNWTASDRTIRVLISPHPMNEWSAYWHETIHAILSDMDVALPEGPNYHDSPVEKVCNALAFARVQEMRAALPAAPRPGRTRSTR